MNEMDYDGWVMKRPDWSDYIDVYSFQRKRTQCIKDFMLNFPRASWAELKRQGWRCVKVKLVEVAE